MLTCMQRLFSVFTTCLMMVCTLLSDQTPPFLEPSMLSADIKSYLMAFPDLRHEVQAYREALDPSGGKVNTLLLFMERKLMKSTALTCIPPKYVTPGEHG